MKTRVRHQLSVTANEDPYAFITFTSHLLLGIPHILLLGTFVQGTLSFKEDAVKCKIEKRSRTSCSKPLVWRSAEKLKGQILFV